MNRCRVLALMLGFVLIFGLGAWGNARADLRIGVLAKRGAPTCMAKWGATGAYLTEKLGEKVTILPLKFTAIEPLVKKGAIDFLLANSAFYVELEKQYGIRAIATMVNSTKGTALKEFGGVILVRKDSPIETIDQLKGKKFMCVKYSSFGGGQMAWRLLLENGVDPQKDFTEFLEGGKHDNVVLAVNNGTVDAGTVRSDTLERMQQEGKISMADFRIIHQVNDDFPFVHSTVLYPEWPMAALKQVDDAESAKVAAALKAMPADSEAAKRAKILGWTSPADYTSVADCLRAIGYGSFKGE